MGRKRKSGEGTVRLRKDGRWEGRVVIGYDEKGLPKTKNVLAKTKGECVEKLKALRETISPTIPSRVRADMSFEEWLDHWYETYSKPTIRPRTQRTYEGYLRLYIKPKLGSIPLNKLTTTDIQQFCAWMKSDDHMGKGRIADSQIRNCYSAADSVVEGDLSAIYGNNGQVMTISNKDNPLQVGDTIQIGGKEVTITCAVSDGVYSSEYSVICSAETFEWLTGETNYSLIGIQLDADADDETIRQINNLVGSDVIFDDLRQGNQEDAATYLAAQFVLYSFLAIIAMITLFNIINSISMSVTARIKQYGAMRAVGMDGGQLARMITAESLTYAISGLVVGCVAGLLLSRYLHIMLLTRYFGTTWSLPVPLLCIIFLFDFAAAFLAAYAPSKRIRNMAITEIINEL